MNSTNLAGLGMGVAGLLMVMVLITLAQNQSQRANGADISFSQLLNDIDAGRVRDVVIQGSEIHGVFASGQTFRTYSPNDPTLIRRIHDAGVSIAAEPLRDNVPWSVSLVASGLLLAVMTYACIFVSMWIQESGGNAFGSGNWRAKHLTKVREPLTFDDVAGIDEAKEDLEEIVEFLRDPEKYQDLGGRIPRGVLLVGSPGTGKTLLARAIAGEANVPFFSVSGSAFVEMFVGLGAARVRSMFEEAKKDVPCMVFIDEIDAVGRRRGVGLGNGNDEREQTLNQLLVGMDGFEVNAGVILIAATNRPDVLDPALLRPGRFDRQVVVPNPDVAGREQILRVHVRKVPLAPDVNLKTTARATPGFSGANIAALVNEAALLAVRRNKDMVTQQELNDARDKIILGAERKSLIMTEDERMLTAYHEGGHALVALSVKATDPIHNATVMPRGRSIGRVVQLPEHDELFMCLEQMTSRLAIMMGGRVAEELVFGHEKVTSAAALDIEQATRLARMMVMRWGYSDELGIVAYEVGQDEVFLRYSGYRRNDVSDRTVQKIDSEIKRLVASGYAQALNILSDRRPELETLAKGLLEYETLSGDEIKALLAGTPPTREGNNKSPPQTASAISGVDNGSSHCRVGGMEARV